GDEPEQRGRLRVVDEADVPSARQLARVHLVVGAPRRPLLLVEVLRRALQRVGELADLGDQLAAADVRVIGERLMANGDWLEHAAARYSTSSVALRVALPQTAHVRRALCAAGGTI